MLLISIPNIDRLSKFLSELLIEDTNCTQILLIFIELEALYSQGTLLVDQYHRMHQSLCLRICHECLR
jgi:hypothetical protein